MTLDNAIAELVEDIKTDYAGTMRTDSDTAVSEIRKNMIAEFEANVKVIPGRKYIKIVTGNSVWGFIVATDADKKFPIGTILKAASWNAPARNHSRGNVIEGGYSIRWTGPHYM